MSAGPWIFGSCSRTTRYRIYLQLFTHHFGSMIPVVLQAYENDPGHRARVVSMWIAATPRPRLRIVGVDSDYVIPRRARLNTIYITYLWICHGFPQLQRWLGFEHGKKYQSLEIMRYAHFRRADIQFRGRVAAAPRLRRGYSVEMSRGDAAAAT